jgi:hypothetical protein
VMVACFRNCIGGNLFYFLFFNEGRTFPLPLPLPCVGTYTGCGSIRSVGALVGIGMIFSAGALVGLFVICGKQHFSTHRLIIVSKPGGQMKTQLGGRGLPSVGHGSKQPAGFGLPSVGHTTSQVSGLVGPGVPSFQLLNKQTEKHQAPVDLYKFYANKIRTHRTVRYDVFDRGTGGTFCWGLSNL